MKVRKGIASAAALAAMACASAAFASSVPAASDSLTKAPTASDLALTPPVAPVTLDDSGPTTMTPLMYWLSTGNSGVNTFLTNNKINITGYIEGGYFYDTSAPRLTTEAPTLIAFPGAFSNRGLLDQLDMTLSRTPDTTKSWDWGFTFENGYGTDYTAIHSSGLLDNRAGAAPKSGHPQNQYDITQAFAQLVVPGGVTLTAGKFVGLLGEEVITPIGNQFYTHSYSFTYGVAATLTGVYATYTFPKAWAGNDVSVLGGITRGWNQSLRDGNGAIDGIAQLKVQPSDKLTLVTNVEFGPEGNGFGHVNIGPFSASGMPDNSNYWTTLEEIATYQAADNLQFSGDFLYSDAPHNAITAGGNNAQWYGVAAYGKYTIDPHLTLNLRAEYYRDEGGYTTGTQANYYEATVGLQIKPFPTDNYLQWLQLRPEVREDWADRPVYNHAHSGGGDFNELTVAMDAIMQF